MRKQIGVAFCPTDEIRTIATFDPISREWIWVNNFDTE